MLNFSAQALFCGTLLILGSSLGRAVEQRTVLSPVYTIDKMYRSMEGPTSTQNVALLPDEPPQLIWITAFWTDMVGADGKTPSKAEYMCHVNLDFNAQEHRGLFAANTFGNSRILTLSQGELAVRFPKGFGVPVMSNEPLSLTTQVLNLNNPNLHVQVRHKVTFEFIRDRDLHTPMRPLFNVAPFVMAPLTDESPMAGMDMKSVPTMHGDSCLPAPPMDQKPNQHAPNANGGSLYKDEQGRPMSGHWVVPPGRSEVKTNVTKWMNLPFDTTLHFAAVHLHPYAESLELKDLTTNKIVFKSHARNPKNRIGLDAVDNYSSEEGTPLFKDHQYELASVYNNPTSKNSDSMAVMLLFLMDKEFKKPLSPSSSAVAGGGSIVVMQTTLGDLHISLNPETAPRTVQQFLALVGADAYLGVPLTYIQPGFLMQWGQVQDRSTPISPEQQALLQRLPLEVGALKHQRGVLSMARNPDDANSAVSSFCILLGDAPHLDGHYTAFGRVEASDAALAALETAPRDAKGKPQSRIEIKSMKVSTALRETVPSPKPSLTRGEGLKQPDLTPSDERLVLVTDAGTMTFRLYPKVAPKTVAAISRWAKAGIFNTTHFSRLEQGFVLQLSLAQDRLVPLTQEQQTLITKLPAEFSAVKHHRGVLSMARQDNDINSAETSFSILLGDAPHLDGKYTIFGELDSGQEVLAALEKIPVKGGNTPAHRLTVEKAAMVPIEKPA